MLGCMKAEAFEHKLNARKELLQQILSTARSINNAAALRKITISLVTCQKMYPSRWRTLRTTCL